MSGPLSDLSCEDVDELDQNEYYFSEKMEALRYSCQLLLVPSL